ncbi:PP2C family protein-serine/threonine phosphatase [Streptomyces odontomachi]|uniref:PP2C family protein-serine/threonine phosphatase n=1 Tax=Streptomyces odontomachi TaxID=2944940 RepID=UPI00210CD5AF|nr:PP2C family protein-serine/threonine phosphatase [Streptomyces sp. ODS25]
MRQAGAGGGEAHRRDHEPPGGDPAGGTPPDGGATSSHTPAQDPRGPAQGPHGRAEDPHGPAEDPRAPAQDPGADDPPGGPDSPGPIRYLRLRPPPETPTRPPAASVEAAPQPAPHGADVAVVGQEVRAVGPVTGRRLRRTRAALRAAPWVLLAVGVIYDVLTPQQFSGLPVFVAAPVIAAPFYSVRTVLVIAALSIVAVATRHLERSTVDSARGVTTLITCFMVGLVAAVTSRVVSRSNVLLASAREIAAAAQRAVLPEPAPRQAGLDVATRYEAAQAGAFIGGDFYAAQDSAHGVRLVVGDVRGKGMEAVSAVAIVIGAFREAAEHESSLEAVAQRLDHALAREDLPRPVSEDFGTEFAEEFATAVLAEVPHGHDTVRIVNRGHPPPLLLHPDGRVGEAAGSEAALPLGMTDLGTWPDRSREMPFPPGTTLLLFTDGLTEARDRNGVFYDPVAGLRGRRFDDPRHLLDFLTAEVRRHTADGATDDLALLAVRRP